MLNNQFRELNDFMLVSLLIGFIFEGKQGNLNEAFVLEFFKDCMLYKFMFKRS